MNNTRVEYIDLIKGIAIYLVVIGHVIERVYDINYLNSPLVNVLYCFHMPLFMFVSGFLAGKANLTFKMVIKKAFVLLLPFTFVGGLYIYVYNINVLHFIFSNHKGGYWYLIVLFESYVLYYVVCAFRKTFSYNYKIEFAVLISPYILLVFLMTVLNCIWIDLMSLKELIRLYIFFVLGVITYNSEAMMKLLMFNSNLYTICALVIICLFPFNSYSISSVSTHFFVVMLFRTCIGIAFVFLIFYLINHMKIFEMCKKIILYMGSKSLSIYLFHFFFLSDLVVILPSIVDNKNILIDLIYSSLLGIPIIGACLFVEVLISKSVLLSKLFLGRIYVRNHN